MKKILLTGGSGFVGRNIIEYFEKNFKNDYAIDAPRSSELNVLSKESVDKWFDEHGFYDVVLHFAVYTDAIDKAKDGSKMLEYNLKSFMNFYEHRKDYERMIYSGSGAEFDKRRDICNVSEEQLGEEIPLDAYGLMKYSIAQIIENSENIYNARIFGLFGQYEYSFRFITAMINNSIAGVKFDIRQNVYFDYLYIDEFVTMLKCLIDAKNLSHHSYNMVSGKKISLVEICELINEVAVSFGKEAMKITVLNDGLNKEYTASRERFEDEFSDNEDWVRIEIREAIYKLYEILSKLDNK